MGIIHIINDIKNKREFIKNNKKWITILDYLNIKNNQYKIIKFLNFYVEYEKNNEIDIKDSQSFNHLMILKDLSINNIKFDNTIETEKHKIIVRFNRDDDMFIKDLIHLIKPEIVNYLNNILKDNIIIIKDKIYDIIYEDEKLIINLYFKKCLKRN